MLEFHSPLNLIVDDIVIVYNIFYSNDYIYIISNNYFMEDKITRFLSLDFKINHITTDHINLFSNIEAYHESNNIYKIKNIYGDEHILLTIIYNNNNYEFNLSEKHFISSEKYDLISLMTLFKSDYELLLVYINYYKSIGIKNFTFYYNYTFDDLKKLKNIDKIIETIEKDESIFVNFIEWPYNYWIKFDNNLNHNAQTPAIADMYYKSSNRFKYLYFNDLDEYLFFDDPKVLNIQDFLKKYDNIDVFQLNMYWSKYINETIEKDKNGMELISYSDLEKNFDVKKFIIQDNPKKNDIVNRSKILLKTNLGGCSVHKEIRHLYSNNGPIKIDYKRKIINGFYHICNLKDKPRHDKI